MPLSQPGRRAAADGVGATHASLHSTFPGDTGAGEISGGTPAYARKAVTFGAATGDGQRSQTGSAIFDVPGGVTLRYVGFWTAVTGGTFLGYHPLGNQPAREFVVEVSTDLVRSPGHGYADGQQVVFCGGTPPGGLTEGTVYFVRDSATDTFRVAATDGGTAIDLTSQAASGCQVIRIIAETIGSQTTATLSGATLALNH